VLAHPAIINESVRTASAEARDRTGDGTINLFLRKMDQGGHYIFGAITK